VKTWFLIVLTGFLFGSLGLCTKYLTNRGVDPIICASVPYTLSAVIALARHRRTSPAPWREGLAMGAVNAAIPALMFNFGFSHLPASVVTLILSLAPIFTALTAHIAFHDDRFSRFKVAGLALSFGGVAFLAGAPAGTGTRSALALAVTFFGAIISGSSLVWVRRMAIGHDRLAVLAPMQVGAAIVTVIASAVVGRPIWNSGADQTELAILAVMGIGTLAAFFTILKASESAPASRVGLMGYIVPLVGVGGGVLVLGEPLTANLAVGGLLVLAGVSLVGRADGRPARLMSGPDL
jgi:drug/metabolite transporter (DMT)-like permease